MSVLSRLIGLFISVVGATLIFMTMNDPQSFIWLFVGLLIISIGFNLLTARGQPKGHKPPPPTITEIRCSNTACDFKEIRDFKKGDFVLKPLETKCPKCGSLTAIEGVYIVKEEEPKAKSNF
ncbi:MAG: hypothetical protein C4K47_02300 [Candidatus Thorarchaeota archaeon]|nr:MAG: hypothetical protein C4K47_02300 [Candidatus Thorarchaeota archaeon]